MDVAVVVINVFTFHGILVEETDEGEFGKSLGLSIVLWPAAEYVA